MKSLILLTLLSINCLANVHPSLLLFHEWDLIDCPKQTQKAIAMGATKVNIVPTLHYYQENNQLKAFCFKDVSKKCSPFNQEKVKEFSHYLYQCLRPLAKRGVSIMITPHLDSVNQASSWRNYLTFYPSNLYGDLSYEQVMINPIIHALKKLNLKSTQVSLSLQGEMGATIFKAPNSYLKLYKKIKKTIAHLDVGISLNFNTINGGVRSFNIQGVQALINAVDFIGYSEYSPITLSEYGGMRDHFSRSVNDFIFQWQKLGLYIPTTKPLIFSEVGLGGGTNSYDGKTIAMTPEIAASVPSAGIVDPAINPWVHYQLKELRRTFYRELKRFFKQRKSSLQYQVEDAYIWNANSWDVLGLYPRTHQYRDSYIVQKILNFN